MEIGDAGWEPPAADGDARTDDELVERTFWALLIAAEAAWIAGLVFLGVWLA